MKIAPVFHQLRTASWARPVLVHTGQHYDPQMSDVFWRELGLPSPDLHLGVGSGTHAEQTAGVMLAYERVCLERRRPGSSSSAMSTPPPLARWSRKNCACRSPISKPGCAAATGQCRRRSTGSSPTRFPICCGPPRPTPTKTSARRRGAGKDRTGRQHHDRLVRDAAAADRRAPLRRASLGLTPNRITPSSRCTGRPMSTTRRCCRPVVAQICVGRGKAAAGVSDASAHPPPPGRIRPAGQARSRRWSIEPLGYIEFMSLVSGARACDYRFRRRPGGDDLSRHSVPDRARDDRAPDHDFRRDQSPGADPADRQRGRKRARRAMVSQWTAGAMGRKDRGAGRRFAAGADRCRLGEFRVRTRIAKGSAPAAVRLSAELRLMPARPSLRRLQISRNSSICPAVVTCQSKSSA